MPDELDVDLDHLTVNEIDAIEEIMGMPIDELFAAGHPRGKALRAVGLVMKRRTDPSFTLEQAGDLVIRLSEGDAVPPTPAAGS